MSDKLTIFMLMPFKLEFKSIYDERIKKTLSQLGHTLKGSN